jgi:NAD(P)-dependent dehydrogenase (short-subunit alcohol dehydrogenase family)
VNPIAAFDLERLIASSRQGRAGLAIVNVSSIFRLVSGTLVVGAGYSASKAGLIGLSRELAGKWEGRRPCQRAGAGWSRRR